MNQYVPCGAQLHCFHVQPLFDRFAYHETCGPTAANCVIKFFCVKMMMMMMQSVRANVLTMSHILPTFACTLVF